MGFLDLDQFVYAFSSAATLAVSFPVNLPYFIVVKE